jgi:hypothetical protein
LVVLFIGRRRARVVNARACTLCRECIRGDKESEDAADKKEKESEDGADKKEKESEDGVVEKNEELEDEKNEWEDLISLRRVKDHFICKYYVAYQIYAFDNMTPNIFSHGVHKSLLLSLKFLYRTIYLSTIIICANLILAEF